MKKAGVTILTDKEHSLLYSFRKSLKSEMMNHPVDIDRVNKLQKLIKQLEAKIAKRAEYSSVKSELLDTLKSKEKKIVDRMFEKARRGLQLNKKEQALLQRYAHIV